MKERQDPIQPSECPHCKSLKIIKKDIRHTKRGDKQRYQCKECGKKFITDLLQTKGNIKIIALTMDLYYKGLSLRDIEDTITQFYNVKVDHSTIGRWINKFGKRMNDYVRKQHIEKVSRKWKADEQMVKAGGNWMWGWNIIDPETKYLLASTLTESRDTESAANNLKRASRWTKVTPSEIVTDGAFTYGAAIRMAYPLWWRKATRVEHKRYGSIRDKRMNNNDIERYHGTFREFDKVRRGFNKKRTGQANIDGFRTYYNYIREHTELGMTPAEAAGIKLNLGENRWLGLLEKSLQ